MNVEKAKYIILLQFMIIALAAIVIAAKSNSFMNRRGMVRGIIYTVNDDSTAQIDDKIVREGETIHGVKILRIEQFYVEFKKGQYTWQQKVLQRPDPAWNAKENNQSRTTPFYEKRSE